MVDNICFRRAVLDDLDQIWLIISEAISKRKEEGSDQWQDGYPNKEVLFNDVSNGHGYVAERVGEGTLVGYVAVIDAEEPAYEELEGKWLTDLPYIVIHRLAVSQRDAVKGLGTWMMLEIEKVSLSQDRLSIKVDTNYDNIGMLRVFEKLGYRYCGEVIFRRGARRKAFEKVLA